MRDEFNRRVALRSYGIRRRKHFDALGLCTRCGEKRENLARKSCDICLSKLRESAARNRRPGTCSRCRKIPMKKPGLCPGCKIAVNKGTNGRNTAIRKVASAAVRLVTTSEYINKNLGPDDMLQARKQVAGAMKMIFRAVHE